MTEPRPTDAPRPPDAGPAVPPNPTAEPNPTSPEILDFPKFSGLYGRLLIASTRPSDELESVLKPDAPIGSIPEIKVDDTRDYSQVTWNLSATERVDAWRGKDNFNDNLSEWKRKFTSAVNANEKRKKAFAKISGQQKDQYGENDIESVYRNLCEGESDTSAFAKTLVDNLVGADGKVKKEDLEEIKNQIEWIASKLFGKQTSLAVARIVEIEASIKNEKQATIDSIISQTDRINNLTPDERPILAPVHGAIVKGPPPGLEVVPAAPIETEEEEEEKISATSPAGGTITEFDIKFIPTFGLPEDTTPENIVSAIKSVLAAQTAPRFNVAVPLNLGKELIVSTFVGKTRINKIIDRGTIEEGPNGETVLRGVRLERSLGRDITLNLILDNNKDGLTGKIEEPYEGGDRDEIEEEVGKLQLNSVDMTNNNISKDDPNPPPHKADKISLSDLRDSLLITFHRIDPLNLQAIQLNQPT